MRTDPHSDTHVASNLTGANLLAAGQQHIEKRSHASSGWNAGVALAFGDGISLGITAGGNVGHGEGKGNEQRARNTHIGDAGSQTILVSGDTTTLKGAQILGQGVQIDAAELHIASLQDSAQYKSDQMDVSAQVTVGWGFSASGSVSQSNIKSDYASVTEQSGLFAGDDGYQIKVKGHTDLKGGLITSTAAAEQAGKNSLTTATLTTSDIANHADYEGTSFGIGGGFSKGGGDGPKEVGGVTLTPMGRNHTATNPETGQTEITGGKTSMGGAIGYGSDSDHDKRVTKSGINTQNITITDQTRQEQLTGKTAEQVIASVHTDVNTGNAAEKSGALANNFDQAKVQKELDLQRDVTQKFAQNWQAAGAMLNEKKDELKQAREKGAITEEQYDDQMASLNKWGLALDTVAAGLYAPTGSVGGSLAAAASPSMAQAIGSYFKEQAVINKSNGTDGLTASGLTPGQETAHILAHGILAAAVAAAGGNDALTAGLAAGGAEMEFASTKET